MVQTNMLHKLFLCFKVVSTLMTVKNISPIFKLLDMLVERFTVPVNRMRIWVGFVDANTCILDQLLYWKILTFFTKWTQ